MTAAEKKKHPRSGKFAHRRTAAGSNVESLVGDYPEHPPIELKNRLEAWWPGAR